MIPLWFSASNRFSNRNQWLSTYWLLLRVPWKLELETTRWLQVGLNLGQEAQPPLGIAWRSANWEVVNKDNDKCMIESRYQMLTADVSFHGHSKIVLESSPGLLNVHAQVLFIALKREENYSTPLKFVLVVCWQTDASLISWIGPKLVVLWFTHSSTESWFFYQFSLIWMFKAVQPQLHLDYITLHSKWQIIAASFDIQCNNINHDEFPFTIHVASIHYFSWIPLQCSIN